KKAGRSDGVTNRRGACKIPRTACRRKRRKLFEVRNEQRRGQSELRSLGQAKAYPTKSLRLGYCGIFGSRVGRLGGDLVLAPRGTSPAFGWGAAFIRQPGRRPS